MRRNLNIVFFTIATIIFMAVSNSYAQTPLVPIPNPAWPLDSVVNGSVHFYTVPGDPNYADSSYFVWTVEGGRLFFDEDTLKPAGNGITATVRGNGDNITRMWVIWDSFITPLDTGYIYVYEISADSCQRSDMDAGKFRGMRIKVSAPPKVRFIDDQTIACANNDTARIIIEIEGMPPYDLIYTLNDVRKTWHITASDLESLDGDGIANNVSFFYSELDTLKNDEVYNYRLDSVSSGGVYGDILKDSTHYLIVHLQPPAPVILHEWTEATRGTDSIYTFHLIDEGVNPEVWYWNMRDMAGNLKATSESTTESSFPVMFNDSAGWYYVEARYQDTIYGCYSPFDSLNIELFDIPTIAFSDNDTIINCSATSFPGDEIFEFKIVYTGARTYGFTYKVYDDKGVLVPLNGGDSFDLLTNRSHTISIPNNFINDTDEIRPWKVVITEAHTEGNRVKVNILDSEIEGGRDERVIMIYPKPFVQDDIDFAN
jgi:hypothetical protein